MDVNEISLLGATEEGQGLVGGELLFGYDRPEVGPHRRQQAEVVTQIHRRHLDAVPDGETSEARPRVFDVNGEPLGDESCLEHGQQPIDGLVVRGEKIQVTG